MKKEYVAPKAMFVEMADNLMDIIIGGGSGEGGAHDFGSNSMSFMDFGGSAGGSRVAFN
jgi:hypothetical protein